MSKTIQNGYFKLPVSKDNKEFKWLHFSMNAWFNLQEDSGKDLVTVLTGFDSQSQVEQYRSLSQVAYAAAKAFDQEEGNDIDYNFHKVLSWMDFLTSEDSDKFMKALTWNVTVPKKEEDEKK